MCQPVVWKVKRLLKLQASLQARVAAVEHGRHFRTVPQEDNGDVTSRMGLQLLNESGNNCLAVNITYT